MVEVYLYSISRYLNIEQLQTMFVFPAGIHISAKQMNKEIECCQYAIDSSSILYLLSFLSKEWLPGWYYSDNVSPFTFSWTNICKPPLLSLCCPSFSIPCILAWNLAHDGIWFYLVVQGLICFHIRYPEKLFPQLGHRTSLNLRLIFCSSIEKKFIPVNFKTFFFMGIKLATSANISKIYMYYL